MTNSKISFYISSHKPSASIENQILHTVKQNELIAFLRGGTEEDRFMAERANEYCELLTQYWAWKYEDADYYGFGHYRRLFSFRDKNETDNFNIVHARYLSAKTAAEHLLDSPEAMADIIEKYDVIAPVPYSYEITNVYEQYKKAQKLHIEDLDLIISLIEKYEPDYLPFARQYLQGKNLYICNMFFMKKQLFYDYSAWLFGLLKKFYENRDMLALNYNAEAMRTPGHLGERLFGIYYTKLLHEKKYKTRNLNILQIENTEPMQAPGPAFSGDAVPIFMATNAYYAKFTAAALQSITEHAVPEHNYDIIVLHNNLDNVEKARLLSVTEEKKNISLRFVNPEPLLDSYNLYESKTITKETYYRLIIPEMFTAYDKVLYLDSDLVVLDDPALLLNIDIGDNYIGGVIDICHAGDINGFTPQIAEYYRSLGADGFSYINAGVLIMNTALMRNRFSTKYLLDFAQQGNFLFQDQDLLNLLCEDKIYFVGFEWNYFADPDNSYRGYSRTFAPKTLFDAYSKEKGNIRILHFAGNEKPWFYPNNEYAQYFWKYFRKTPYYELYASERNPSIQTRDRKGSLRKIVLRLCPAGTRRRAWAKKLYHFLKRK